MKLRYMMCHIVCTSALLTACQTDLPSFDSYNPFKSANDTTAKSTKPVLNTLPSTERKSPIDDKIFAEILTLDKNEIAAAREGEKKATQPKIREFAKYLVKHHSMNLNKTLTLSHKLKITPEDDYRSMQMQRDGERELTQLKTLDESDFDSVFLNDMIRDHRQALSLLNDALRKVTNPMLKAHLMAMYQVVEHHLEQAQALKA